MGLTKIKKGSNMYQDWLTHTWNPVSGECPHGCMYCYMNSFKERYPNLKGKYSGYPEIVKSEMKINLGKDKKIFVCNCQDLFAEEIDFKVVLIVLTQCAIYPDNTYFFQTKNPAGFIKYKNVMPKDSIFCITLESDIFYENIMYNAPTPVQRVNDFCDFSNKNKMVTIEPIMKFSDKFIDMLRELKPVQVNIGANKSTVKLPEPSAEEIHELITQLSKFTKVVLKQNLTRLYK